MGSRNSGRVIRSRKDLVNPRTGSHTHIDQEIQVRQSNDQRIVLSETMRTIRDTNSTQMRTMGNMHDNQTMVQLSANQLHSIVSENTARAYEASLDAVLDVVTLGHRQAENQRTMWICCMIIIAYLTYLLGISRGENSALKAMIPSHLTTKTLMKLPNPITSAWNLLRWNRLTSGISTWLSGTHLESSSLTTNMPVEQPEAASSAWHPMEQGQLINGISTWLSDAYLKLGWSTLILVARASGRFIFISVIVGQLILLHSSMTSTKKLPLKPNLRMLFVLATKYGGMVVAQVAVRWTVVSVLLDLLWILYVRRP
ncbi:MAG: hypothetical protein Q9170_007702 [Blastenia crenularia]